MCYNVLVNKNKHESADTKGDMKMTAVRYLESGKVREMCIKYQYYTHGDCEAYEWMLGACDRCNVENINEVKLIAMDIYFHSTLREDDEYSLEDKIAGIMYGLYNECMETIVTVERGEI